MINVNTYTKAHDKGKGSGGTTVINNGGSNNSTIQNFKLINVETANINDLTAKNIKSNDASITYLSSDDGSITKITGKELNYDKAKIGSIEAGKIDVDRIDANALNVRQAIIDVLKSKEISTEYLTVTKQAHFFELVIDKLKSVGGQIILTPTNCVADYVFDVTNDLWNEDSYYRVYFKATDSEGRAITNDWRLYDQAICQTFNNVVSGGTNQNKYYWRLVIGKNDEPEYFDLTYGYLYNGGIGVPTWDHTLDLYEIKGAFKESTDPTYANATNVTFDSTTPTTNASLTGEDYEIQSLSGGINRLLTRNGLTSVGIQKKLDKIQTIDGVSYPNRHNYFFIKVRRQKDNPVDVYFVLKDQTVAYFPFDTDNIIENTVYNVSWQDTIMKFDLSSLNNSVDTIIIYNKASSIYEPCHYIDLSNNPGEYDTNNPEGLVENIPSNVPGVDDNICQLGYDYIRANLDPDNLDDDTKSRASAIIIAAYKTPDSEITAPSYAQYQYIHTFELSKYRCTYFDAKGGKIDGNITFGNNIEDRLKEITDGEVQYRLVSSMSSIPVRYDENDNNLEIYYGNLRNTIYILRQYKNLSYTTSNFYMDQMPEGKRFIIRMDVILNDNSLHGFYFPICTISERDDTESIFYRYGSSGVTGNLRQLHYISGNNFNIANAVLLNTVGYISHINKTLDDIASIEISLKTISDEVELGSDVYMESNVFQGCGLVTKDSNDNWRTLEDVSLYGLDASEFDNDASIYWGYAYMSKMNRALYTADGISLYSNYISVPSNFGFIDKVIIQGLKTTYDSLNDYVNSNYERILTRYAALPQSLTEQYPKLKVIEPIANQDPNVNVQTDETIQDGNKGIVKYKIPDDNYNLEHIVSGVYWMTEIPDSYYENNSLPSVWMSQATIDHFNVISNWSTPIKITGERGQVGASGSTQKFIYCSTRTTYTTNDQPRVPHTLSGTNIYSVDNYNITEQELPITMHFEVSTDNGQTSFTSNDIYGAQWWSIYPTNINSEFTTRWMSTSIYDENTNTWSNWSTPVVDAKWGEKGMDASYVEYIYYLAPASDGDNTPDTPWTGTTSGTFRFYRDNDLVSGAFSNQTQSTLIDWGAVDVVPTALGWTDNPLSVSAEYPIQYVSYRTYQYSNSYKAHRWSTFSEPLIWNVYSGKGNDGTNGDKIRIIYIKSKNTPSTLSQDQTIPAGWSLTMPMLTEVDKAEGYHLYMSQCIISYDAAGTATWSSWSPPLQLDGPGGKDPLKRQYIYSYESGSVPIGHLGESVYISYLEELYDRPDHKANTENFKWIDRDDFDGDFYEELGSTYQQNWSSTPLNISEEHPNVYVAFRDQSYDLKGSLARNYAVGQNENTRVDNLSVLHWTEFSEPILWSHYGTQGLDGFGLEYIYKIGTSSAVSSSDAIMSYIDSPNNESNLASQTYQTDGFVPTTWSNNPVSVTSDNRYLLMSQRKQYKSGEDVKWGPFSTPVVWTTYSSVGIDGGYHKFIYAILPVNYNGGAPAFTTDNEINNDSTWSLEIPDTSNMNFDTHGLFISNCFVTFNLQGQETFGPWEDPTRISGDRGSTGEQGPQGVTGPQGDIGPEGPMGKDGETIEFIYKLSKTNSYSPHPATVVQAANGSIGANKTQDRFVPNGWTDNPTGVDDEWQYEFVSIRRKLYSTNENNEEVFEWSDFSNPAIWAKWGEKGQDGSGIEYVFVRTPYETTSVTLDPNWKVFSDSQGRHFTDAGFLPYVYVTTNGATNQKPTTDEPQGVTDELGKEWVFVRRYTNGEWTDFNRVAKLWAYRGQDGDGFEYIYYRTTNGKPSTPTSDTVVYDNDAQNLAEYNVWTNDPRGVTEVYKEEYVSVRHRQTGSTWDNWSTPALWGRYTAKGTDGSHWVFAYMIDYQTATVNTPATGTTIANLGGTWSTTQRRLTDEEKLANKVIWMTQCEVDSSGVYGVWTTPIIISGVDGMNGEDGYDGIDGTCIEYIYKNVGSSSFTNGTYNGTYPKDITTKDSSSTGNTKADDDFIPQGWSDHPTGVTETNKFELVSQRIKKHRTVNGVDVLGWGDFTDPVIWSKWGEKGMDGDGFEYIYKLTGEHTSVSNPTPLDWETNSNYQNSDEYVQYLSGWTDEPTGVSTNVNERLEWVCIRQKHNGVWGQFSNPAVWARKGQDGDEVEYVYKLTNLSTDLSNEILYPNDWNTMSSTYQTTDEYCSFLAAAGHTNWTDDPQGIDPDDPDKFVEWMSYRKKKDGVWGQFSSPSIWTIKGQDGTEIEYVYKLSNVNADYSNTQLHPNDYLTNTNYQGNDEYQPFLAAAGHTNWTDNPSGVDPSDSEKYVEWMSYRKKKDGVWGIFSPPIIWSRYTAKGTDGMTREFAYKIWNSTTEPTLLLPNDTNGVYNQTSQYYSYGNDWYSTVVGDPSQINNTTINIWMTSRTTGNNQYGPWSTPFRLNGENGENGTDGGSITFLYCRTKSADTIPSITSATATYTYDGVQYKWGDEDWGVGKSTNLSNNTNGEKGDTVWFDHPQGLDKDSGLLYEWAIERIRRSGEQFGEFSDAVIWSAWGDRGQDGDGYEYVYILTSKSIDLSQNVYGFQNIHVDGTDNNGRTSSADGYLPYSIWNNEPHRWTDNPSGVSSDSTKQVEWVSSRKKKNGTWGTFSRPAVWSRWAEKGSTGNSIQVAYIVAQNKPETPTNGTSGTTANTGITNWSSTSGTWSTQFPDDTSYNSTNLFVWMIQRFVVYNGDTPSWTNWSTPIRINGAEGPQGTPGTDGGDIEFLYCRRKTDTIPYKPDRQGTENYTYSNNTYTWSGPDWGYGKSTGISNSDGDNVWNDNPQSVNETFKYEFVTQRTKSAGSNWSSFSTPVVWSKWGEKGQDGDGYEYIFRRTTSDDQIPTPSSQNTDNYVPTSEGWFADPQGVTSTYKFEWVSKRKRQNGGSWGSFSRPTIWAKWSEDGVDGRNAKDGSYYEYGYKLTTSATAPSASSSGWSTTPSSISQNYPYLWRRERLISFDSNNSQITGSWGNVILIGKWGNDGGQGPQGPAGQDGQDGQDGGVVYALVATKSKCGVYINTSSNNTSVPFRLETDFAFTVTKIDGNGASTMSQSDLSGFTVIYYTYKQDNTYTNSTLYPSSGTFTTSYTGTSNYYQSNMSNSIVRYEFRLKKGSTVVDTLSYDVNVVPGALQQKTDSSISDFIQNTGIAINTSSNGTTTKTITKWFEYMTKNAQEYLQEYGYTDYINGLITSRIKQSPTDLSAYIKVADMKKCGIDINYNTSDQTGTVSLYGDKVNIKKSNGNNTYAFFDSNGFLNVGSANGYGVKLYGSNSEGAVVGYNGSTETFRLSSSAISGVNSRLLLGGGTMSSAKSFIDETSMQIGNSNKFYVSTSDSNTKYIHVNNNCYFGSGTNMDYIDFGMYNNHGVVSSKGNSYGLIFNNIYKSSSTFTADGNAPVGCAYIVGPGVTAKVPSGHTIYKNNNDPGTEHRENHIAWILIKGNKYSWYTIGAFEQ